jgi:hypothetical protein
MPPTITQIPKTTTEVKHVVERSTRKLDLADFITLATPILTFLLGYFLNKLVEDYKENQRLNQVEKYYFSLLRTLTDSTERQATELDNTANNLKLLQTGKLLIPRVTAMQTTRIKSVSDMDLYKAFILRRKNVDENNIQLTAIAGAIDFITESIPKIEDFNKEFFEKQVDFGKSFNADARELLRMKNILVVDIRKGDKEPSTEVDFLLKRFDFHISKHQKKNGFKALAEPTEIYNNLIVQLLEDLKTMEPTNETYPFASLLDSCKTDFLRFFAFRDAHISRIKSLATSLRTIKGAIDNAARTLQA